MRLIDADALKTKKRYSAEFHENVVAVAEIDWMPTIDAVPIVRCVKCKWCEYPAHNSTKYGCKLFDRCVKPDWFCADGERKDGAE